MITVRIFDKAGILSGFEVTGHSGSAPSGEDIVCAAVSSAAYMTANTVTEVLGLEAEVLTGEALMRLKITDSRVKEAQALLTGFQQHIAALCGEYPQNIKIVKGVD